MLTLITEQFLNDPRLVLWKSNGTPMNEKCRQLWDQLGMLWVCIVLNPRATATERMHWKTLLEKWSKNEVCPQEDPDFRAPVRPENVSLFFKKQKFVVIRFFFEAFYTIFTDINEWHFQYRERSHRIRERDRNRFFRENNMRNLMYQRNQQQQQQPNRDNYNNNNNDDNYDSSESDSDSDADMDDNQADGENDGLPANDNNNPSVNNEEEDEQRPHNDLLANIADDAQPDAFDENSRSNYELPILGESSGCNLNLEIVPPTVNDDSSRESMDMDYDSEKPTLGNIVVERNPRMEPVKERNDSDEEVNFYENDEFCSYLRNGEGDELKGCKCRKCANNCTSGDCCEDIGVRLNDDEDFNRRKNLSAHNYGMNKSIDDKLADYSDDNDMDIEERDTVEKKSIKCTCFEQKLDHVNGHSSKMCLELPKEPCEKCATAKNESSTSSANDEPSASTGLGLAKNPESCEDEKSTTENSGIESKADSIPENVEVENAEAINPEHQGALNGRSQGGVVRNRDNNGDLDNVRPNKRAKLNNGSASNRIKTPRTIFHKALDAVSMSWENQHLKNILASSMYSISSPNAVQTAGSSKPSPITLTTMKANFNSAGQPLWHEPLSMCASRVDSLRSHGHTEAALRLSVSVVRTMKQVQKDAQCCWKRYQAAANIPCNDDIPKKSNSCCCDCSNKLTTAATAKNPAHCSSMDASTSRSHPNNSNTNNNNNNSSNNSNGNNSNNGSSRKRSYDSSTRNSLGGYSSSSSMSNRAGGYKMYRFGDYHSSYRYSGGMNNEHCKRCLEQRERVGYQNSFNSGYNTNRFNSMNGNGMHPPHYFRNNFAPMHGNMFDQHRFNSNHSNHFGSNGFRYGNNYPMPSGNHQCHSENCNMMHRSAQQNNNHHHLVANDGPFHGNGMFNNSHGNSANRCSHDLKLREMINAPMQPRPMRHDSGNTSQNLGCRSCNNKTAEEPSTSGIAGPSASTSTAPAASTSSASASSSSSSSSSASAAGTSTSSSAPMNKENNHVKNFPIHNNGEMVSQPQHNCSQQIKNQCCVKNYCCNVPNEPKPKCCRNEMHQIRLVLCNIPN